MDFVVILVFIFSAMAVIVAINAIELVMKLTDRLDIIKIMVNAYAERTEMVLDLARDILNDNKKAIEYIDTLEKHISKEEPNDI